MRFSRRYIYIDSSLVELCCSAGSSVGISVGSSAGSSRRFERSCFLHVESQEVKEFFLLVLPISYDEGNTILRSFRTTTYLMTQTDNPVYIIYTHTQYVYIYIRTYIHTHTHTWKKEVSVEVTRRWGRWRKQLLVDLKETKGYSKLKEKTLACPLWRLAVEETMVLSQNSLGGDDTETHTDGIVKS
jgi:hypothetical protein